jgi:glucosyl-dolichyl phosphate glucuronosyltransferase
MSMIIVKHSNISVIICAYTEKRWNDTLAAVQSVQQQSLPAAEIILVIDHNPELLERARREIPGVVLIENTSLQGLSGARNCGVAVAREDLVAFLDDDAEANPDWLALIRQCCEDPQVLGVGGLVVPLWPETNPAWFPKEFYWVIGCSYQDFQGQITRVRNAFGGNICFRREVFTTVGGFRNDIGRSDGKHLPLGGEETELCIRAGKRWPDRFFLCDPRAITGHHILPQRVNTRYFRSRCYAEGLSKALVATYSSSKDALSSEQAYTRQILPRGVMRGIRDGFRGDVAGFARAWMIIVGLLTTARGYFVGTVSNKFHSPMSPGPEAVPLMMFQKENELPRQERDSEKSPSLAAGDV